MTGSPLPALRRRPGPPTPTGPGHRRRRAPRRSGEASIAALARQHQVSRAAISGHRFGGSPAQPFGSADALPIPADPIEIPGQVAGLLDDLPKLEQDERNALTHGRITRRGRGYTAVTAPADIHQMLLCTATTAITADVAASTRKAYRTYAQRVTDQAQASTHA